LAKTFFAYHLTHFFGPFSLESYHTNDRSAVEGSLVYVVSGDNADDGGKDYYLEGVFRVRRRDIGPFVMRLRGETREFAYRLRFETIRRAPRPIPLRRELWYVRKEIHDYFSSGQNFNPLLSAYQERFDLLLAEYGRGSDEDLTEDLLDLERRVGDPTERQVLALARIGQGRFRTNVIATWAIVKHVPSRVSNCRRC
jgi:hypothetical protein